jgi:hypothetical protein
MVSELDTDSHEFEDLVYDGLSELDEIEIDLFSYSRPLTPEPPNCEWHYPSQPMDPEPPEDEGDDVDELIREDREVEAAEQRSYAEYRQRPSFYWGTYWEDLQDLQLDYYKIR